MSLKQFHILFISACVLLMLFMAFWSYSKGYALGVLGSSFAALGLIFYMKKLLRWLTVTLSCLFVLALPSSFLSACSVCFGNTESLAVKGMSYGIMTLLLIIFALWGAFGYFFFYLWKRQRTYGEVLQ